MFCCVVSLYISTSCAKYTAILHSKTSNKRFIIQLLLSMKEGESDSFAYARRPVLRLVFYCKTKANRYSTVQIALFICTVFWTVFTVVD